MRPGFEVVIVVGQAGDVDQALDRQLDEPAEEAEVLDADDDGVERLADVVLQVGQELDLDQLALGGLGPALGPRAVLGQDDQLVDVALGLLAVEDRGELAVDLEVGIAADRRGEVAVVLAGQGVVALRARACRPPASGSARGRSGRRTPRACRPSRRGPAGARTGSAAGRS